jgi:hypothetical protein
MGLVGRLALAAIVVTCQAFTLFIGLLSAALIAEGLRHPAATALPLMALYLAEVVLALLIVFVVYLVLPPAKALSIFATVLGNALGLLAGVGAWILWLGFVRLTDFHFGLRSEHELFVIVAWPVIFATLGTFVGTLIRRRRRGVPDARA